MNSTFILEHDMEISSNRPMDMRYYLQKPDIVRKLM